MFNAYRVNQLFLVLGFIVSSTTLKAQMEKPHDPYLSIQKKNHPTSPAYKSESGFFWMNQVNVTSNGDNIVGDAANEPSIAVNPKDRSKIAMGWRQFDDVNSDFRQAGYGYTVDGGKNWTFPGVLEPGIFRSDPVLGSDANGNFYYNSLTYNVSFYCKLFKSDNSGASWDSGVDAYGGDKLWMTIDNTEGPGKGNIYSYWTTDNIYCIGKNFTRSTDNGKSFEPCTKLSNEMYWGTLDVGPDGTLYASSSPYNQFAKSINAQNVSNNVNWDITEVDNFYGTVMSFVEDSPNPEGILGQTWVATNHAQDSLNGQIYLLASKSNDINPLDVRFIRSTDGGNTWSMPIIVNDDADSGAWHWFATMSVAPTGRIDVVWLDTRNNPGTYLSSLYYANSYDGGLTWSTNQRLTGAFNPHLGWPNQRKMGDYYHMVSDSFGVDLAFSATFNLEQDVYYGRINVLQLPVSTNHVEDRLPAKLFQNTPNPFSDHCTLRYQLEEPGFIQLDIINPVGTTVYSRIEGFKQNGSHSVQWDAKNNLGQDLPSGVYYCQIRFNNNVIGCKKMVLLKNR